MYKSITASLIALLVSACATGLATKDEAKASMFMDSGSSKSDGIVNVALQLGFGQYLSDTSHVTSAAAEYAADRCAGWGYEKAESTGGIRYQKIDSYSSKMILPFQCVS